MAGIHLYYEEQVITTDVVLEARGAVRGHLVDPAGSVPVPGATIELASDTASAQGWRRPLLAWLKVQALRAQQGGDAAALQALQRRIALVEGTPR